MIFGLPRPPNPKYDYQRFQVHYKVTRPQGLQFKFIVDTPSPGGGVWQGVSKEKETPQLFAPQNFGVGIFFVIYSWPKLCAKKIMIKIVCYVFLCGLNFDFISSMRYRWIKWLRYWAKRVSLYTVTLCSHQFSAVSVTVYSTLSAVCIQWWNVMTGTHRNRLRTTLRHAVSIALF